MPEGTLTFIGLVFLILPSPPQLEHFFLIVLPVPLQLGQTLCVRTRPNIEFCSTVT